GSQAELKKLCEANPPAGLADNCADVDLFLTMAANMLRGAGAGDTSSTWHGKLYSPSATGGIDKQALELLGQLEKRAMARTAIYGGSRVIDFPQFTPRGHYTKDDRLRNYFRAMMWLGRSDTGWFTLPVHPGTQLAVDDRRELRNAMLLVHLL